MTRKFRRLGACCFTVLGASLSLACSTPGASEQRQSHALTKRERPAPLDPKSTDSPTDGVVEERVWAAVRRGKPVDVLILLRADVPELPDLPRARPEYVKRQWLAALKADFAAKNERLSGVLGDVEVRRRFDTLPLLSARITKEAQLQRLASDELVGGVVLIHQNDLYLSETLPLIRARDTIQWGQRGAGVGIAVIDTGVQFSDRTFGTCGAPGDPGCRIARSVEVSPDDGMQDDNGHGSAMSAIALGVAPAANLHVFDASRLPGRIDDEDALTAIDIVINTALGANIRALSLSYGVREYWDRPCEWRGLLRNPYQAPFGILRRLGVMPVVAVGNDGENGDVFRSGVAWPACSPGAVRVGAVYDSSKVPFVFAPPKDCSDAAAAVDAVACFSQSGPLVSLFAPGATVSALGRPGGAGTSESAPQVAAASAVLAALRPLTLPAIESILLTNGPVVTDPRANISRVRLDVAASLIAAAGPIPDDLQAAQVLDGPSWFVSSTSYAATLEPGEPLHGGAAQQGGSVWFRWTAPYTGPAEVTTQDSDFDTLLAVYVGATLNSLSLTAQSDDDAGGTFSRAAFQAQKGTTYSIAVSGKVVGGVVQRGLVRLRLNRVANDDLGDAIVIPDLPAPPVIGANLGATKEAGEYAHCGNDGGASVWYRYRSSGWSGLVTATLLSDFIGAGACVSVYSSVSNSPSVGALQFEAGGTWASLDDTWSAEFLARADRTYFIAVEGMSSEQPPFDAPARGTFTLSLEESRPPVRDE